MKRTLKLWILLAVLCLTVGLLAVTVAAAETGEEGSSSAVVMFTIVDAEGNRTDYYDERELASAGASAPSGATLIIQANIATYGSIDVTSGKILYVDLNGKTLINKNHTDDESTTENAQLNKTCFLNARDAEVTIYSSKPGAAYFARNQKQQNPFASSNGTATLNIGAYPTADGETVYSGDNISVYGCSAVNASGTAVINISGGYYYRNHSDYSGLLMARNDSTINLTNAKLLGSYGAQIFSFQTGGSSRINCDGCIVAGTMEGSEIIPPAQFLSENSVLTLKNTAVYNGILSVGTGKGRIVIEEGCVFDSINDEDIASGSIVLPEGYRYAKTNRTITIPWSYNDYYNNLDAPFRIEDHTVTHTFLYGFAPADEIATITWQVGGTAEEHVDEATGETVIVWTGGERLSDEWICGVTPRYTGDTNPHGSYYYEFPDIVPVAGDAEYVATQLIGSPDKTIKAKLSLHSSVDFCIYFPASLTEKTTKLWYNDVIFPDGTQKKITTRDKETVDGVTYYVLRCTDLGVEDILSPITLTFRVTLNVLSECDFTNTLTFSVLDYAAGALTSAASAEEKALLIEYLSFVSAATANTEAAEAHETLSALLRSEEASEALADPRVVGNLSKIPTVTPDTSALYGTDSGIESVTLDVLGGTGLSVTVREDFTGSVIFTYKKASGESVTATTRFTDGKTAKGAANAVLTGTRLNNVTVKVLGADGTTEKAKFVYNVKNYLGEAGNNAVSAAYCTYLGYMYMFTKAN